MPFLLVVAGILMIVTGAKGTYQEFGKTLANDFTGPGNFLYWLAAIGAVGSLGYIDSLRTFSRAFMALILIAMVLANEGFFDKLMAAIRSGPEAPKEGTAFSGSTSTPRQGHMLDNPIDLGPLGTVDPKLVPGSPAAGVNRFLDDVWKFFGGSPAPGTTYSN